MNGTRAPLHDTADERLGHGDDEAEPRYLVETEQGCRSGAWTDQRTGMHVALGDDAIERRSDLQVLTEIPDRPRLRLRGFDRVLVRSDQRLRGFGGLLRDLDVVLGDDAWRRRRRLQTLVGPLSGGELGLRLGSLQLERLRFRFGLDDLCLHLRRFKRGEDLTLLHDAAAIDARSAARIRTPWRRSGRQGYGWNSPGSLTCRSTDFETTGTTSTRVCASADAAINCAREQEG